MSPVIPQRRPLRRVPLAVLLLSLATTAAATYLFRQSAKAQDQAEFENVIQSASDRIRRRLDAYIALLRATDGLFASQQEITADEFATYVRELDLQKNYPGIQGIGFTLRFAAKDREAVERRVRAQGAFPEFRAWPPVEDREVHSIVMLEPRDNRNLAAVGYNMFEEPIRREAMARARDTGEPALSGSVILKQEIEQEVVQPGFLLYVPVYSGEGTPRTVEERRERLQGFAYSPFRAVDLLRGIFGTEELPRAAFWLHDGSNARQENLLFASHPPEAFPSPPLYHASRTLTVAGRPWTLVFSSLPAFDETAASRLVAPVALVGLTLSLLMFLLTQLVVRAYAQEERITAELSVALRERSEAEERLREADRRKDEFLAVLGHELRNPLAPVLSALELMRRKPPGADLTREREIIDRQTHGMQRLVDDLLDVSRISRGKINLQRVPVDLTTASLRALEAARPLAEKRGHAIEVRLPSAPLWAEVDPVRFEQMVVNLLNNSAKYSEPGGRITLSAERAGEEILVRVADTGVGLSAEALQQLFEPFVQVGRTDKSLGGLGLGLALVKRLIELHGGRVEAASEGLGKGSTFTLRIPAMPAERVPAQLSSQRSSAAASTSRRRILVVDDNVDAAEMLAELLELDGHQVSMVHDGLAALECLSGFNPDVVFLDIGLPGIDGYEVARRIRQRPEWSGVRLVALTGYGQASDRRRSAEAGFDAHLVKPVDIEVLRSQALSEDRRPPAERDGTPDSPPRG